MAKFNFKKFVSEAKRLEGGKEDDKRFIMPSDLDLPVYLMCPPFSLDSSTPNNALMKSMSPEERKTNKLKAIDQFLAIYGYVSNAAMVYLLPSRKGLGDLPYVANLGINLPHTNDNTIIISNYKSEIRQDETPVGVDFFNNLGYQTVVSPPYFEGEADLKHLNKNVYCGAYGIRTDMNALNWFSASYHMNVIPVKMVSEKMYHLDCVMFPLESEKLFTVTSAIDKPTLKKIEKHTLIIDVDKKAGEGGLTNCVRLGNTILNGTTIDKWKKGTDDYYNEKYKNDALEKLCANNGYDVTFFDISEFDKSGAALSCMFMHLNWPNKTSEEI